MPCTAAQQSSGSGFILYGSGSKCKYGSRIIRKPVYNFEHIFSKRAESIKKTVPVPEPYSTKESLLKEIPVYSHRVSEPDCFGAAPAPGIFYPEPALAPGKREHHFGIF